MQSIIFRHLPLLLFFAATFSVSGGPTPVVLRSIASDSAWLELARPASSRPPVALSPLEKEPWSMEEIRAMGDAAQAEMLRENRAVRDRNRIIMEENDVRLQRAAAADLADTHSRQRVARQTLSQTSLGRAVLAAAEAFGPACSSNGNVVATAPIGDDIYLSDETGAVFVSLLFQKPQMTPLPPPVPGTSSLPVHITLPVIVKAESEDGGALLMKTIEQTQKVTNPDCLFGEAYDKILLRMALDALDKVAKLIAAGIAI